ncbi:MAG: zf-HC2 domain-containing protein [Ktedonobacteraceae bacterium]|nr:zf-HC2 domain-containing protein [Ktedonobacteraceae bacterium]
MHCSKASQQLQLYLDKRLPLEQMRALEQHLADCPGCRRELLLLEQIEQALGEMEMVAEPPDLTVHIMQRVAITPQRVEHSSLEHLRPSLSELAAVFVMATALMLGVILSQPSLHQFLPVANGHDVFSLAFLSLIHMFDSMNSGMLMLCFWVVGTILGVWITLVLAGKEVKRTDWFKAMIERLPVR